MRLLLESGAVQKEASYARRNFRQSGVAKLPAKPFKLVGPSTNGISKSRSNEDSMLS